MEFFGFACGNSSTGPNFPFLPESVLKDYPAELTEHPALPSVPFSPYDFVPMDLSSIYQGFVDSYFSILHSPVSRTISAGIIAASIFYYTWRISVSWADDMPLVSTSDVDTVLDLQQVKKVKARADTPKDYNKLVPSQAASILHDGRLAEMDKSATNVCFSETGNVGVCISEALNVRTDISQTHNVEQLAAISESFQRQLIDALTKLDDVRFRLKELESEKELLAAEIELRKKITQKLQVENSSEREMRQQAELKMEMMEIENNQVRHLRKELAIKAGHVEKLEKLVKEKDDVQIKLFEDNVVLPRAVAEARAKEFGTLQSRVHQLQTEVDATKRLLETGSGYLANKASSSMWSIECPVLPFSPMVSEVPVRSRKNSFTETSVVLPDFTLSERGPNPRRKIAERSPNICRSQKRSCDKSPKITRSTSSATLSIPSSLLREKASDSKELCRTDDSKPVTNDHVTPTVSLCKLEDSTNTLDAASNKNVSVFAHIRAFINGFRDSSSETEFIHTLDPSAVQSEQNTFRPPTNMTHSLEQNQEYPLSDEQSSVFMSASGGSDISDTDHRADPIESTSKSLSKKPIPVKRLSKYKRDRRRDKDRVSKRRLASRLSSAHASSLSTGHTPDPTSDSSDLSHKSTVKSYPIVPKTGSGSLLCAGKCTEDNNQDSLVPTLESSDDNDADSGDSWIVIMPAAS